MIQAKTNEEYQLQVKPRRLHQPKIQKDKSKTAHEHNDTCRYCDDVPKSAGPEQVRFAKYFLLFIFKNIGIFIIHKKSDQIEKSGKIADHKNDVNGFDDGVEHPKNLSAKI